MNDQEIHNVNVNKVMSVLTESASTSKPKVVKESLRDYLSNDAYSNYKIATDNGADTLKWLRDNGYQLSDLEWLFTDGKDNLPKEWFSKKESKKVVKESDDHCDFDDFNIDGFEMTVTDEFEDGGYKGYNIMYSKNGNDIAEVEVWVDDTPVTVIDSPYSPNLFDRTYDSFSAFADDLQYKTDRYIMQESKKVVKESKLWDSARVIDLVEYLFKKYYDTVGIDDDAAFRFIKKQMQKEGSELPDTDEELRRAVNDALDDTEQYYKDRYEFDEFDGFSESKNIKENKKMTKRVNESVRFDSFSRDEIIDYLEDNWNQPDFSLKNQWEKTERLEKTMLDVSGLDRIDDSDNDEGMYHPLSTDELIEVAKRLNGENPKSNKEYDLPLTRDEIMVLEDLLNSGSDASFWKIGDSRKYAAISKNILRKINKI